MGAFVAQRLAGGLLLAAVVLQGATLAAQTDPTPEPAPHPCDAATGPTKKVCRAGYDALTLATPAVALLASRGNPSLGSAGGGGRFGQATVSVRGTYLQALLPATSYDGTEDAVPAARRLPAAVPSLDLRFPLLTKALPIGAVSVDFLGAIVGLPRGATDFIRLAPGVRSVGGVALGFGYGLRIGMTPSGQLPTASLNVTRHDFPRFTFGDLVRGSNFAYTLSASAMNVRLLVGRRSGRLEFTAGGGADLIKGDYSISYVNQTTRSPISADSTLSALRIVTVANAALDLVAGLRIGFEGGFQVGKDDKLPTRFEAVNPKSGRFFGGVGLGFKL